MPALHPIAGTRRACDGEMCSLAPKSLEQACRAYPVQDGCNAQGADHADPRGDA
jgi:hypothetical protein